jgi:hypothetical protein
MPRTNLRVASAHVRRHLEHLRDIRAARGDVVERAKRLVVVRLLRVEAPVPWLARTHHNENEA